MRVVLQKRGTTICCVLQLLPLVAAADLTASNTTPEYWVVLSGLHKLTASTDGPIVAQVYPALRLTMIDMTGQVTGTLGLALSSAAVFVVVTIIIITSFLPVAPLAALLGGRGITIRTVSVCAADADGIRIIVDDDFSVETFDLATAFNDVAKLESGVEVGKVFNHVKRIFR